MRVFRSALLKVASGRWIAEGLWRLLSTFGVDVDRLLNSLARGFRSESLLAQIRRRPSTPLLLLLSRRWRQHDIRRIERRRALGKRIDSLLGKARDDCDTYWVYPVVSDEAGRLVERLHRAGFDATTRSRMGIVATNGTSRQPTRAIEMWRKVLFLPWYPELSDDALDQMAAILVEAMRPNADCNPNQQNSAG